MAFHLPAVAMRIPSPPGNGFHVGPAFIHYYGLMYVIGITLAILITQRRWTAAGGDPGLVGDVAIWSVPAGIVGGRIYFDITTPKYIPHHWWGVFAVWDGGLGIWGAIPAGVAAGALVVRRSGNSIRLMMDAVAPGLLLAQGIGRWGNYWNQELYGKPTSLPWGLQIDQAHQQGVIAPQYQSTGPYGYYQPTFLYEFLWDMLGVGALLWIDRRFTLKRPALFALYVAWYTTFRTVEEVLRIDPSNYFLGMRINFWVSLVVWIAAVAFFIWWQFVRVPSAPSEPKAKPRKIETGPAMAVPKGRVR
jgi:prolipoprotein diacylglyceryl transferase